MTGNSGNDAAPRVLIRADASREIGAGHVARSLVLAQKLSAHGAEVVFWTCADTPKVVPQVTEFALYFTENAEEVPRKCPVGGAVDLLVVDHYGWSAEQEGGCREWARSVMVLDDQALVHHDADILLNQNTGFRESDYDGLLPTDCRRLIGPEYALLRPEFAQHAKDPVRPGSVRNIFVCFGLGRQDEAIGLSLAALMKIAPSADVLAVAPGGEPERFNRGFPRKWRIIPASRDMASDMAWADIVIGAGGVSLLERCAMGVPSLTAILAENQWRPAQAVAGAGGTSCVDFRGAGGVEQELETKLARLIADASLRQTMSLTARSICDGAGGDRVVSVLMGKIGGT